MNVVWFYEEGGRTRGAVSLEELVSHLAQQGEWRKTLVWREGFAGWKNAAEVDELSCRLIRPPPLPRPNTQTTGGSKSGAPIQSVHPGQSPAVKAEKKPTWILKALGWIGLFLVAALARGIGGEFGKAVVGPTRAEQIDALLSKSEALARAELPKKLNEFTTLVAVDHQGNRMRFHYLVVGSVPPTAIGTARATVLDDVCAEEATNGLDAGVAFEYIYQDKQSKPLGAYTILKSDCKKGS